jgi:choline dehydrogenase-like flavoprotein
MARERYDVLILGFENRVVDASAIPEIPSANTNVSTIPLAEHAAEWI